MDDIIYKWTKTEYIVSFDNGQRETERIFKNEKEMIEFAKSVKRMFPTMYIKETTKYDLENYD